MISIIYLLVLFIILTNITGSSLINNENSLKPTSSITTTLLNNFNNETNIKNDINIPVTTSEITLLSSATSSILKLLNTSNKTIEQILPTTVIPRELLKYRKNNKIITKIIELTTTTTTTTRENLRTFLDIRNLSSTTTTTTSDVLPSVNKTTIFIISTKSPISSRLSETSTINSTYDDIVILKKLPLNILSSSSSSSSSFISFKNNDSNERTKKILTDPTKITTTAATTTQITKFLDNRRITATTTSAVKYTTSVSSPTNGYFNITSQAGTHAYLPCNVKQFIKKPISWIRIRDGHILTVDQTTFIADQRFQSLFNDNPERWSLQIKFVQPKDSGWYECQVSTEPKSSSKIHLHIVEPQTRIIGESTRHVKAGSPVIIRCTISEGLEQPLFINWFYNNKQIYLHNKNRWKTEIDREAKNFTIASLIISSVTKKDSGNYTCRPSNSESATVVLHVLNGEYSASAITSSACGYNINVFHKYYYYYYYKNRILIQNLLIYKIILYLSYLLLFKISSLNI